MWENGTPAPPPEQKPKPQKSGEDLVLWAQLFVCGLALAVALAARQLALPVYPALRSGFRAALSASESQLLEDERRLMKFAELTFSELRGAASEVFAQLSSATPESARTAHGRHTEDSYLPAFPLTFPLPGRAFEKTSAYGWRTDPMGGQGTDFHTGIDLAAAEGTPVLAAADGVVRTAGWHQSYGNYLRILHKNGDETLYAHMQYLFVAGGEQVTAGQVLGTVGQTGNATGPHLHFEILHEGTRYDPAQALETAS